MRRMASLRLAVWRATVTCSRRSGPRVSTASAPKGLAVLGRKSSTTATVCRSVIDGMLITK